MTRNVLRFWCGLVGILVFSPALAQAQTLHAVGFFQTSDPSIGTVVDLSNFTPWVQSIASNSGLTLDLQTYSGADFTVTKCRQVLTDLKSGPNDVIYFYYSGHGGNPPNKHWPVFDFQAGSEDDVSLDVVVEKLKPKNPRLLLVVADCCNSYPNQGDAVIVKSLAKQVNASAFKSLFVNFRGTVIATGASRGQYSSGSKTGGGDFTNAFMATINSLAASNTTLTWDQVLFQTRTTVGEAANPPYSQTPDFQVTGGRVAGATTEQLDLDPLADQVGVNQLGALGPGLCGAMGLAPLALTLGGILLMGQRYRRR